MLIKNYSFILKRSSYSDVACYIKFDHDWHELNKNDMVLLQETETSVSKGQANALVYPITKNGIYWWINLKIIVCQ